MDPHLLILSTAAFITGFSKFSVGGLGMLIAPILMLAYPGQEALGVLLPMYLLTDLMVVSLYRKQIAWRVLLRFIPLQILGMSLGTLLLARIDTEMFRTLIGFIILGMLGIDWLKGTQAQRLTQSAWFVSCTGLVTGLISMLASAGGPLVSLYMMSLNLTRTAYVSTRAWSFIFIDLAKIPLLLSLDLLNKESVLETTQAIPSLLLGASVGYFLLQRLKINHFKWLIRLVSIGASAHLIIG